LTSFGPGAKPDERAGFLQAALPDNPAAARLYVEGMLAMRRFDAVEADALLTRAASLEPEHAPTHALLAAVLVELGYQKKAEQEYEIAVQNSRDMSPQEQTELLALRCKISGDWATAASVYAQLLHNDPEDLNYILQTASAQIAAGQTASALQTLSRIPLKEGTGFDDAEVELVRSLADAGNFDRQLDDAARAENNARASGQPLIMARALVQEGNAQFILGRWGPAQSMWQKALDTFDLLGDRRGMANVLYQQSKLLWVKREPVAARRAVERSIDLSQGFGNDPDLAASLAFLGVIRMYSDADPAGEAVPVKLLFAKANDIYKQDGNLAGQGMVLGFAGDLDMNQSHCDKARAEYTKGMELSKAANDKSTVANRLLDLGIVAAQVGDNMSAERDYTESIAAYLALGQQDRAALVKGRLSGIFFLRDEINRAIQLDEEALQTLEAIGHVHNGELEGLSRYEDERNPARAESIVRELLGTADWVDPRARAGHYMVLAEAELAEGKLNDAKVSIKEAFRLEPVLFPEARSAEMLWTRAEVSARDGKLPEARLDLKRALALSMAYEAKPNEMQVRLALAEIDMRSQPMSARTELERLESDSQKLGYLMVARKVKADLMSMSATA
jgi:tetratricopeptide (TPR) repeat protein